MERVDKPWGYELIFAKTDRYVGKVLVVRKGHKLSLQYHKEKDETIFLQGGEMILTVEEDGELVQKRMTAGDHHHIAPTVKHRMEAVEDCTIFEVSTTQLDDVVRIEDAYGRAGT